MNMKLRFVISAYAVSIFITMTYKIKLYICRVFAPLTNIIFIPTDFGTRRSF